MLALKEFRSKIAGLPDLLNYAAIPAPGIVLNKDGSLMAAFYYRGQDLQSSTNEELAVVSEQVNGGFIKLGSGWLMHVDAIRVPATSYPDATRSFFQDVTTLLIDQERRAQHQGEGVHFETVFALTLTYLPPSEMEGKLTSLFVDDETVGAKRKTGFDLNVLLARFEAALDDIIGSLSARLRFRRMTDDEMVTYLHMSLTGLHHPVKAPPFGMYLDSVLGSKDFYTGYEPRIGNKHIRTVTINGFPGESYPGILDTLNALPLQYRWSTRWIALDTTDAEKRLNVFRRNWFQKRIGMLGLLKSATGSSAVTWQNGDAVRMAEDADAAINNNSEGLVRFGYYTSVIVICGDSAQQATDDANTVSKILGNIGFPSFVEKVNAVEAFLGTLPAHGYQNVRRAPMHTLNLADLLPLTAVWSGHEANPCPFYPPNSPPLLYAATTGATPYRLSLHVNDLAHTLVLGPTGAGKSALLSTIMAQHLRYRNAQVFAFDKGYSAFILAKAAGGTHYDIASETSDLSFCPLAHIDTEADKSWAKEYIELLVLLQMPEGSSITTHQRAAIHDAIERLSSITQSADQRTITHLCMTLQDQELKTALAYYTIDGTAGSLLDASSDSLRDARFTVFEMEHLMSKGEKQLVPVISYLFRQIEKRLNGAPTLIVLDEAWIMLRHPLFREKIREWLKVLRKANAACVIASQSLSDVMSSPIYDVIIESTATKILLPNAEATTDNVRPLYESLGLNNRQIRNLSAARAKRDYYVMNADGRRMIELGLGQVALSFVGASGKEDIAKARTLIDAHGDEWPYHWMKSRNVQDDWCALWLSQKRGR